jgi:microcystin-dependent protein
MSQPYLGEIKMVSFNFAPKGWATCNGQLLPINQNQALFALLGTFYGGNGQTNFQLPNLQGRVPLHMGNDPTGNPYSIGQAGGNEAITLSTQQMPGHLHTMQAAAVNAAAGAAGRTPASNKSIAQAHAATSSGTTPVNLYAAASPATTMAPLAIANTGGSQPHSNLQPFLVINFCIALIGVFPSRN